MAIYTHPVQYYAPLFRALHTQHPEIDLDVIYLTRPTDEQQGQGFGVAFQWDQDLLAGYPSRVLREPRPADDYTRWLGLDVPEIRRTIRQARPDVVLLPGWSCRGLVRALFACNRLRIPALYRGDTNLWQRPRGARGAAWAAKNRFLLRRFSGYAAVGKRARIFLREHGVPQERIVDSPHAVDTEWIQRTAAHLTSLEGRARARAELGIDEEDFVVLFVGKLEAKKRPEDAIRAVAQLGPRAVVAVCGSGPLEEQCRKAANEARARVVWLGFRNQSQLPPIYAIADVLLVPSGWGETWGLVVNEAMAVGTPCIVSDAVGCAPDLVEPGVTGDIYPAGDLPFLVDALGRMRQLGTSRRLLSPKVHSRAASYTIAAAANGIARLAAAAASSTWSTPVARRPLLALCDGMVALGGMERRTMEILDDAAEGGARVHCVFEHRPARRFRLTHRAERSGHSWSATRVTASLFSGERSIAWALRLLADTLSSSLTVLLAALHRRAGIVFVASFGSALRNWPALAALRLIGVFIVLRSGNAPATGRRHRWIWNTLVDPVVDVHVANSDFIAHEILATGVESRKTRVIRNPLPVVPCPTAHRSKVDRRIIYVGQVVPEKGILELLDALQILQGHGIAFEALFVGRFHGWEHPAHHGHKDAIAARMRELPAEAVRVLGEREDVLELMASASVHCCPSQERQREGLANVVLQAKAVGTPSVVTPSGALPEMVRHGVDGWVCRGFDPEAIAEGLTHFLLDSEACRRAGERAAAWRDPSYLHDTVADDWQALLCGDGRFSKGSGA